jgi:hypothetical protein
MGECTTCSVYENTILFKLQYYLVSGPPFAHCSSCFPGSTWLKLDLSGCDTCANIYSNCEECAADAAGTLCTSCARNAQVHLNGRKCETCDNAAEEFLNVVGTDCRPCDEAYPDCESCDVDASGKTICLRCSPPQYYPDSASSSCLECDNPSEWLNIAGT